MQKGYDHFKIIFKKLDTETLILRRAEIETSLERLRRFVKPNKEILEKHLASLEILNQELKQRNAKL